MTEQGLTSPANLLLVQAPAAVRDSFYAVLQANANRPEDQVNAAVDAWAAAQSPSIAAQYRAFKDQVEKYQMEEEAAHKAAVARFSPAAKQADQRLSQVYFPHLPSMSH